VTLLGEQLLRFPLMALAGLSLIAALWAGLARLGWNLPQPAWELPSSHGPLMVVGFLGTVIGLERAVALKRPWTYGAPLFSGLAGLALVFGLPVQAAHFLSAAGSLFLVTIFIFLYRKQPEPFLATMGLAALLWFTGIVLWHLGYPLSGVVPWWLGFMVLTIAGERLELSRLTRPAGFVPIKFMLAVGLFVSGLVLSLAALERGVWLSGIGLLALAFWLLRYDLAWRTVRQRGLPRFMASCLLLGYAWLAVGGALWIFFPDRLPGGLIYDAMLHSVFLGFVFSMIFAHAPIIFPSITGVAMPFQRAFYGHVAFLHLTLILRVAAGLAAWPAGQTWGGLLNSLAILVFLGNSIRAVKLGRSRV
jgi:hypothetical protein